MKKAMLLSTVILLAFISSGYAQEGEIQGTFKLGYTSKYVWRGFNVFGDKSAIHPSIDLFCPVTNLGLNVTVHRANSSGYEIAERWDYNLYYMNKLFAGEMNEIDYRIGYVYYNFPQQSAHSEGDSPGISGSSFSPDCGTYDLQEIHTILSFPKILGVEKLIPSYVLVKLWPSNSGTTVGARSLQGTASGFAHIFMLDYSVPFTCPLTGIDRDLNLHAEAVFNDGVAPDGGISLVNHHMPRGPADSDWSNAVFGVSTSYDLAENVSLIPGFYYQSSWDASVNPSDEYWASLSLTCKF